MDDWNPAAPRAPLENLSDRQWQELESFVEANPLASFNEDKTLLVVIRRFALSTNCLPDPDAESFRMGMDRVGLTSWGYWTLPLTLEYQSVALTGHHDQGNDQIAITTNLGCRTTNWHEMNQRLRLFKELEESDLLTLFDGLNNERVARKSVTATAIRSSCLGRMKQCDGFDDWWVGKSICVPLLSGKKLPVKFTDLDPDLDADFVGQADAALSAFLNLGETDRGLAAPQIMENCREFLEDVVDDFERDEWPEAYAMLDIVDPMQIWNYVSPDVIYVSRPAKGGGDIYIQVECECAWEEEHGLQLVYRGGQTLTRVSGQDGHLFD